MQQQVERRIDTAAVRDEILELKSQVESSSFSVTDIKKRFSLLEKTIENEKRRVSMFRVSVLCGIVLTLCAIWWVYYNLTHELEDINNLLVLKELQTKESCGCTTTLLDNWAN
jgi:hypothetical protein